MHYVNENPILTHFLPRTHHTRVMPLLVADYVNFVNIHRNVELLLKMHAVTEPFIFPMQHFDQANRNIAIEASRTNLLPLVVTGFTYAHMRKLDKYATSLIMVPRTVIIICPSQIFGPKPFKLYGPDCLSFSEFGDFLESIDIRAVGTHYLRRFMRGEF